MTFHGVVDIRLTATTALNRYNELFVSIMKFMTSSYVSGSNGFIERVAYNTSGGGNNFNYWDEGSPAGSNSWACFRFVSASVPFYMFIQYSNTSWGPPGSPAVIDNPQANNSAHGASFDGVGVSFAMREDGGNPWNGTMSNNGSDTKGDPVWTSGSSHLMVWPRGNSDGGTYSASKQLLSSIIFPRNDDGPAFGSRAHMVCDENTVIFVSDDNNDANHMITYFGKYVPLSGTNPQMPYVMIRNGSKTNDPIFPETSYGYPGGGGNDGGIAHPTLPMSGTRTLWLSTINGFNNTTYQPNPMMVPPTYDEFPFFVCVNESPNFYGLVGTLDVIRSIYGVPSNDTNSDMTRAVFGNSSTNTAKVSIPWNPVTSPGGTEATRTGSMF